MPPPTPLVDPSIGGDSLPRVSVLIVTHDNAGLTALCLDSLDRFTAYPDLEVVVVDNASGDETPAMLRARAASTPGSRWCSSPRTGASRRAAIGRPGRRPARSSASSTTTPSSRRAGWGRW